MVRLLVDNGANPNNVNRNGKTPLHLAAMMSQYDELRLYSQEDMMKVVQLLIDGGADPNKEDHEGRTPLNEAHHPVTYWGIMQLLIAAGADTAYIYR